MVINVHTKQKSKTSEPVMARIIRWPKVHDKVGMCRSHVHQLISKGLFPAQIKLTPNGRASGWIESEVNEWLGRPSLHLIAHQIIILLDSKK
jgi:prophage regulatory protein